MTSYLQIAEEQVQPAPSLIGAFFFLKQHLLLLVFPETAPPGQSIKWPAGPVISSALPQSLIRSLFWPENHFPIFLSPLNPAQASKSFETFHHLHHSLLRAQLCKLSWNSIFHLPPSISRLLWADAWASIAISSIPHFLKSASLPSYLIIHHPFCLGFWLNSRVFQNAQTSKDLRGQLAKYVVIHN